MEGRAGDSAQRHVRRELARRQPCPSQNASRPESADCRGSGGSERGNPEPTRYGRADAEAKGAKVFICAAGMAAHLAGVVASLTTKPVLGVPMKGGVMEGMDALLSTVQMPGGMPVGTVAIGSAGAVNSAYLAMQILAIEDEELAAKLKEDRILKAKKVETDSMGIEVII